MKRCIRLLVAMMAVAGALAGCGILGCAGAGGTGGWFSAGCGVGAPFYTIGRGASDRLGHGELQYRPAYSGRS